MHFASFSLCCLPDTLPDFLEHPRIFVSICWSLLKAIAEGNEELTSEMKSANSQRKLEGFLYNFLNNGRENVRGLLAE